MSAKPVSKPVLAIDIDDVLVPHESLLAKEMRSKLDPDYPHDNMYQLKLSQQSEEYRENIIAVMTQFILSDKFLDIAPIADAVDSISRLEKKYTVVAASARPDSMKDGTKDWLQQHFPQVFKHVEFINVARWGDAVTLNKDGILQKLGAEILVDDSIRHATNAANAGLQSILFGDYAWNQSAKLPSNVARAKDWPAVEKILL